MNQNQQNNKIKMEQKVESRSQSKKSLQNAFSLNLQKLGLELKCPLCLQLFNEPVLLRCNHIFCSLCIPKGGSKCPVCNNSYAPDQEVKRAPFMENIVCIYKNLDATFNAAGLVHPVSYVGIRKLFIYWDYENCLLPKDVTATTVYCNIVGFIKANIQKDWWIERMIAFLDATAPKKDIMKGLHESGVQIVHTPHDENKKDIADRALVMDMIMRMHTADSAQNDIIMITGDKDFGALLGILNGWGCNIYLVLPEKRIIPKSLTQGFENLWKWDDVCRGKGVDPSQKNMAEKQRQEEVRKKSLALLKPYLIQLLRQSHGKKLKLKLFTQTYRRVHGDELTLKKYMVGSVEELLEMFKDIIAVESDGATKYAKLLIP